MDFPWELVLEYKGTRAHQWYEYKSFIQCQLGWEMNNNYATAIINLHCHISSHERLQILAKAWKFTWRPKMEYKQDEARQWEDYRGSRPPQRVKDRFHGWNILLSSGWNPLFNLRRAPYLSLACFLINFQVKHSYPLNFLKWD